jgi:hypothetical protein
MVRDGRSILTLWRGVWMWYSPRTLPWRSALGPTTAQHQSTQAINSFRKLLNPVRSPDRLVFRATLPLPGNYFVEVGWSAAAADVGLGASGCPAKTAVTELGSLSAFASISEICQIWVSDRL